MTAILRQKMVLVLVCLLAPAVWSQNTDVPEAEVDYSVFSLEELFRVNVITASKQQEPLWDAPGVVTVLTRQEIEKFGANNLWDLVDKLPSIQKNFSGGVNSTSVRGGEGFAQNHLLILIDGRPFRSSNGNNSTYNAWATFPVSMIERIEAVRGPGSVLYGTNAFEGVINIVTRKPKKNAIEAHVKSGSFGTTNGELGWYYKKGDLQINFAGYFFDTDGWDFTSAYDTGSGPVIDENGNIVTFTEGVFEDNRGYMGDIKYKNLTLSIYRGETVQASEVFYNLDTVSFESNVTLINLNYNYNITDRWRLEFNFTNNRENFNWLWDIDFIGEQPVIAHESDDYLVEGTLFGQINDQVRVLVGAVGQRWKGLNPPSAFGNAGEYPDEDHLGIYTQVTYRPNRFVKLIAGGQYNEPEGLDGDFVPRLGLIWNFSPRIGLKALYGKAFKSPIPQERRINSVGVQLGFPGLKSETIATYNAQLFYQGERQLFILTAFDSKQEDLIRTVAPLASDFEEFDAYWNFQNGIEEFLSYTGVTKNVGELAVRGVEIEAKYAPNESIFFLGAFSYQENENHLGVKDTTLAPSYLLKLGVGYNKDNISASIFDHHYDEWKDNSIINPNRYLFNPPSDSYDILNATVSYKWLLQGFNIKLEGHAYNILDEEVWVHELPYEARNTIQGAGGRSMYGSIKLQF